MKRFSALSREVAAPATAQSPGPRPTRPCHAESRGTTKCKVSHATVLGHRKCFAVCTCSHSPCLLFTFVFIRCPKAPFKVSHFCGKPLPQTRECTLPLRGHRGAPSQRNQGSGQHDEATGQRKCAHTGARHHLHGAGQGPTRGPRCGQGEQGGWGQRDSGETLTSQGSEGLWSSTRRPRGGKTEEKGLPAVGRLVSIRGDPAARGGAEPHAQNQHLEATRANTA